jgi:hypothetical protein
MEFGKIDIGPEINFKPDIKRLDSYAWNRCFSNCRPRRESRADNTLDFRNSKKQHMYIMNYESFLGFIRKWKTTSDKISSPQSLE